MSGWAGALTGAEVGCAGGCRASWRDPGLELLDALSGFVGLLTQRRGLPGVGEIQQHEDGQTDDRGEAGIGTHRVDEVRDGEGERNGPHDVARSLRADPGA